MSEDQINPDDMPVNDQLVLISGESAGGKSASLRNIRQPEGVLYMNTEAGKRLPFRSKFMETKIADPYEVMGMIDMTAQGQPGHDVTHTIILDTLTFWFEKLESQYIIGSQNTMQGWANYAQAFKTLMQDKIAPSDKAFIILAHARRDLDEATQEYHTKVPVKGSLQNTGIEAYFSTVVAAKRVTIKELEKYQSDLLTITDEDKENKFKYVFKTRLTAQTKNERIRSPMGLFSREQTYMDNDAQLLLDHLRAYYA